MDWIKVEITTINDGIEPLCGALYEMGISGVQISDSEDFKEFLENNRKYWDYVDEELERLKTADSCITFYLSKDADGMDMLSAVRRRLAELKSSRDSGLFGSLELKIENVKDEDWSENWKKYFKPLEVGERVLIVPEWERENVGDTERTKFIINPGMSFGTGSHQSTRMCIEEIEEYVCEGDTVLDLGCGSGILSIIALLLGAGDATAVDIDPMAVETAYANLELNGLSRAHYHGYDGDIITNKVLCGELSDKRYDIVLANIVADVIIALSKFVKHFMKDSSVLICSGIIIDRKDEVVAALENAGFEVCKVREMGEWAAAVCRKKL